MQSDAPPSKEALFRTQGVATGVLAVRVAVILLVGVLVALAVPIVAPPAAAQAPACSTLTLEAVDPGDVAPGGSMDVVFRVTNTGTQAEVVGFVRAAFAADAGWKVTPPERTGITLAANGGSADVSFSVTAPDGRGGGTEPLNAVAGGSCSAGGTPFPLPGVLDVEEVTASMPLAVAAPSGFRFDLGALADVPPLLFVGALAGVLIVGGAVLASRKRGAGFGAKCPEPEKSLRAGRGASFPLEIANRGKERDTARFEVGAVPQGWSAFMALPELLLAAGESRTIWLMVRAPPDAQVGSHSVLTVTVRSKEHPRYESKLSVKASVVAEDAAVGEPSEATRMQ